MINIMDYFLLGRNVNNAIIQILHTVVYDIKHSVKLQCNS